MKAREVIASSSNNVEAEEERSGITSNSSNVKANGEMAAVTNSSNNIKAAATEISVTSSRDNVETEAEVEVTSGSNALPADREPQPYHSINMPTPPYSPDLLNSPLPFSTLHPNLPSAIFLSG